MGTSPAARLAWLRSNYGDRWLFGRDGNIWTATRRRGGATVLRADDPFLLAHELQRLEDIFAGRPRASA